MKKIFLLLLLSAMVCLPLSGVVAATDLATKMSGRILLQVEGKGQAWYVDPSTKTRAFLGRPADAYNIMKSFGLGVSNDDIKKIVTSSGLSGGNTAFARRFSGRILLQIQSHGEAWYVNPTNLKRYYLGRPADAFKVMRTLGLGMNNKNLAQIPVNKKFPESTEVNKNIFNIPIAGFSFNPTVATIKRGMTVVWTNKDSDYHTVTPEEGTSLPGFGSHTLSQGQTYSYTFTKSGTYDYACAFHVMMRGKIIVQ
ncbi:cupredoxin family copper-binding protein [Candidatus Falkowbacteria bacterium]|nr:cupredoxin family copper-binding protein [Candidatus Falkowbacteria bacterium]